MISDINLNSELMRKFILLILMLLIGSTVALTQDDTAKDSMGMFSEVKASSELDRNNVYQPDKNLNSELSPLSSYEFYLSLIVLGFGFFALLVEVWLIYKKRIDQDNIIKFVVVTLIITATLFLITAGYSNNQIAPAMGLLGTIAGYLLGKAKEREDKEIKKEE
jgi:RsiW-degrading membrane proteinase PrsW (M82 family)